MEAAATLMMVVGTIPCTPVEEDYPPTIVKMFGDLSEIFASVEYPGLDD
jgi:hypothetical protein